MDIGPVYYTTRRATLDIDEMDITYVYNAARWFVRKWKRPDLLPIIDSVHSGHARTILKWCILKQEAFAAKSQPPWNHDTLRLIEKKDTDLIDKHHPNWICDLYPGDEWGSDPDGEFWYEEQQKKQEEAEARLARLENQYCNSRFLLKVYYPKSTIPRKRHSLT